jgi:hypothetical protein
MTHMVPMQHPDLPDQPIQVLPEQVPAFQNSGWEPQPLGDEGPTPLPPVAQAAVDGPRPAGDPRAVAADAAPDEDPQLNDDAALPAEDEEE